MTDKNFNAKTAMGDTSQGVGSSGGNYEHLFFDVIKRYLLNGGSGFFLIALVLFGFYIERKDGLFVVEMELKQLKTEIQQVKTELRDMKDFIKNDVNRDLRDDLKKYSDTRFELISNTLKRLDERIDRIGNVSGSRNN